MRFALRAHRCEGRTTIELTGELDIGTAPRLEATVEEWADGSVEVVLDLAELTFIDSSGVRSLLAAMDASARSGCALSLIRSRHHAPAATFRALGLEHMLPWREGPVVPLEEVDEQGSARK